MSFSEVENYKTIQEVINIKRTIFKHKHTIHYNAVFMITLIGIHLAQI